MINRQKVLPTDRLGSKTVKWTDRHKDKATNRQIGEQSGIRTDGVDRQKN